MRILPDISRSKSNQTMSLGQLMEYNVSNIFLKILSTKYGAETRPRSFLKKIRIDHISGSTVLGFIQFVFIACPSRGC